MGTVDDEVEKLRMWKHSITNTVNTVKVKQEILELEVEKLEDLPKDVAVLNQKIASWMESTVQYRKDLDSALKEIFVKLKDLPCRERAEATKGDNIVRTLMWGAMAILFALIATHIGWK